MPAPTYTEKHEVTLDDGTRVWVYGYGDGRVRVAVRDGRRLNVSRHQHSDKGTNVMLAPAGVYTDTDLDDVQ